MRMYLPVCVLQVWSQGAMPGNASPNDIESNQSSWGVGANITTKLINQTGEVRHFDLSTYRRYQHTECVTSP